MPAAGAEFVAELKAWAQRHGLVALGVTGPQPFADAREILLRRHALGLTSPFEEPDVERRVNPALLLPGVRSLIAVAVSYHVPPPPDARPARARPARRPGRGPWPPRGWISRHAWGRDYHRVVRRRLEELAAFIRERYPDAECAHFVDTGPPIDRAVAERAGIGWIGKNCALMVPGAGSWVVLGTLLTTLELPPDPPAPPPGYLCLDCDRCLRACPTGALFAPMQLDPYRCLSYVTQMRGPVPEPLREAMGDRIYGCDTCQAVCPHNHGLAFQGDPAFTPGSHWDYAPDLLALLRLGKREFARVYGDKASGWRGKTVLQRNAVIALGNLRDPRAVPELARLLGQDPRPVIRGAAAWALGRIGGADALRALRAAAATEADAQVLAEVRRALAACDDAGEAAAGPADDAPAATAAAADG